MKESLNWAEKLRCLILACRSMLITHRYPAATAIVMESYNSNLVSQQLVSGTSSEAAHRFVATVEELLDCRTGKLNLA